jgi:hypothetical protein
VQKYEAVPVPVSEKFFSNLDPGKTFGFGSATLSNEYETHLRAGKWFACWLPRPLPPSSHFPHPSQRQCYSPPNNIRHEEKLQYSIHVHQPTHNTGTEKSETPCLEQTEPICSAFHNISTGLPLYRQRFLVHKLVR